jgi:hypothetical protein
VVLLEDVRLSAQQFGHVQQQVAEIGGVQRAQACLVGGIRVAGTPTGEIDVLGPG